MRLKNRENETKNPISSFTSLDGQSGYYFATKLQENIVRRDLLFKRYINVFGEQFLGDQFVILDPFPCHN